MTRSRSLQHVRREEFVRHVPLFAGLSDAAYAQLAAGLREQRYRKNEVVFHAEDPGDAMYLLRRGMVKVTLVTSDRRDVVVALLHPPDFFGEMALLDGLPRSATVTTLEASEMFLLLRPTFVDLLMRTPSLARKIAEGLSWRMRRTLDLVHRLAFLDTHGKVARVLFRLALEKGQATEHGTTLDIRLTQRTLAELAGTTRETTAVVLRDFQQAGFLRMTGGTIILLEPAILERLAQT